MKILLAGSPQISVKAFEEVIKNFDVVGVLTQPDKRKGRGMEMQETAVSALASKYKIKTFKPNKVSEIKEDLLNLDFDLLLTFAFGQWIPSFLLNKGKYKPINIHGSLLPKYRGAAPIHYAILNGDEEIGITLMEMIKEMDAGDMFFKASVSIDKKVTTGDAFEIIQNLAASNIVKWLKEIEKGNVNPIPQGKDFSLSPKIEKSFGELKSNMSIKETIRRVRGLSPFPGAFTMIDGKRLKVFDVVTEQKNNSIELKCKDGSVFAIDFQRESKKRIRV